MLQPQTDAEMHAWNYGCEIARSADIILIGAAAGGELPMPAMSGATRAALDTLGPELFHAWADRGYAAARSITQ